MTTQRKVFINTENMATFVCPECMKSKTTNVSKYKNIDRAVRVKCNCDCGHTYSVMLERRKYYRKETNLPGVYKSKRLGRGKLVILDISRFGLKFDITSGRYPMIEDVLVVEFTLDDSHKSFISKEVVVKKVYESTIGAEFITVDSSSDSDRRIGFYLMP